MLDYYNEIQKNFFKHFEGLNDSKYVKNERTYKLGVSEKAWEDLNQETFADLLKQNDFDKILKELKKLFDNTSLANWRDHDILRNPPENLEKPLCENIYNLLFDKTREIEERINSLVEVLGQEKGMNNSNIWNFITYLLFVYYPDDHYFVKPSVWDQVCKKLGIENPRKVKMNGKSYRDILNICKDIRNSLQNTPLKPRDMIEIQSLLYIYSGAYDNVIRYWVFKITDLALWNICMDHCMAAMQFEYGKEHAASVTKALANAQQISPGDFIIAALKGKDRFLGIAQVSSELYQETDEDKLYNQGYGQRVNVHKWHYALESPIVIEGFEEKYGESKNPYDTIFEVNQEAYDEVKTKLEETAMEKPEYKVLDVLLNNYSRNIIFEGPPGTGKTYTAHKVIKGLLGENWKNLQFHKLDDYSEGAWEIVQFHPNYSFEDFVRGLVAEPTDHGVTFLARDKIFAQMCQKAEENPKKKFALIIDEINRGDLSKILGELIYALEYRGESVSLLYGIRKNDGEENTGLTVPDNLFIIGTMNTADRSIALVDYAIRRRFSFVKMNPEREVVINYPWFADDNVRNRALLMYDKTQQLFEDDNEEYRLGHTYFICGNLTNTGGLEELDFKLQYQVKPILLEYVKEGILEKERVEEFLKDV